MRLRALSVLLVASLCFGCSTQGKWRSSGVPSRKDASLLLEKQGPTALMRDSRPEGAPAVPVRVKLRPCCAFGNGMGVDLSFIRVPGYRIDNIIGADELGPHRYDSGVFVIEADRGEGHTPDENNGLVYTCRGGFVDTAHVRDYVDWTMFLSAAIGAQLHQGTTIELPEEGGERRFVVRKLDAELIREYGLRELFSAFSQWAAFQLSVWHEIATWYGWASLGAFPETASAFSPEDLYSNMLGIKLIDGIIADKTGRSETLYNRSVDVWLQEVMRYLGAVSKETGEIAMRDVDGHWWDSNERLPSIDLVIRRNLGLEDELLPWQVPPHIASEELRAALDRECSVGTEPQPLPIHDSLGDVRFADWMTLEIELDEKLAQQEAFREVGPIVTQDEFPQLVEAIHAEILERFGDESTRPD